MKLFNRANNPKSKNAIVHNMPMPLKSITATSPLLVMNLCIVTIINIVKGKQHIKGKPDNSKFSLILNNSLMSTKATKDQGT